MTDTYHAVVTGGSSGIGKECAKILAGRGYAVTIVARRQALLESAREDILHAGSYGRPVETAAADVSDEAALSAALAQAAQKLGPIHTLVASAGMVIPGRFTELDSHAFRQTMEVNYFGALHAVRTVTPAMPEGGAISLVSSGAGLLGIYGYAAYSPTKFALRGLAEVLRAELKPRSIHVSICYPPDTDTPQLTEENKTKPWETRMISDKAKVWPPDAVARMIIDGIAQRRFAVTPGFEMTMLNRFGGLIIPVLNRQFDKALENRNAEET